MKNSKRLVTLLLALVMLVSAFTIGASAAAAEGVTELTLNFDVTYAPDCGVGSYSTTVKEGGYYKLPGSADAIVWSGAGQLFAAGTTFSFDELKALASPEGVVGFAAFPNSSKDDSSDNNGNNNQPSVPGSKYDLDVKVYVTGYRYGYDYDYDYDNGYNCKYGCKYNCTHQNTNKYPCYQHGYNCKYNCTGKHTSFEWDDIFSSSWDYNEGPYYNSCNKYYGTSNKHYGDKYYGYTYLPGFSATAESYSVAAGETVTLRARGSSSYNYRFVGWYNADTNTKNGRFSNYMSKTTTYTMPAADATVYAIFQVYDYDYDYGYNTNCNKYHNHTIRYTDGVSNEVVFRDVVKTVRHGGTTPIISDPVRPGYRFMGWSPKVSKTATECEVYVAQWSTAVAPKLTTEHVAYLKGYGKGEFRPDNKMTRAEYAVLLYRLLDEKTVKAYVTTANAFSDVAADDWYNEAVSTLANAGVIEDAKTFRPTEYITRAEMISMLANFYTRNTTYSCYYKDVPTNYWAYDDIALAQYMGWIKGYGANTFLPEATITRAEVAAVMNRVLDRDDCKTVDTKKYTDNPTSAWFYQDVVEATVAH